MLPKRSSSPQSLSTGEITPRELRIAPGVYAYYGWKNVSVGVWVGQAVKSAVSGLVEMSYEMAKNHPTGRSSVVFVLDQLPGPTADAQEEMKRVYSSGGLECTAIILEGTGFWASGIRSMTNNVRRDAATSTLLRVNTSIEEVIEWLPPAHLEHTGVTLPAPDFQRALVTIRELGVVRAALAPKPRV
jgi:hypothetical protein